MLPSIDIVALQTLPGWPAAPPFRAEPYWLLLIALPVVVFVVGVVLGLIARALAPKGPTGSVHETQWLGAVSTEDHSSLAPFTPVAELAPRAHGGASVRW